LCYDGAHKAFYTTEVSLKDTSGSMTRRDLMRGVTASLALSASLSSSSMSRAERIEPSAAGTYDITSPPTNVTIFAGLNTPIQLQPFPDEWRAGDTVLVMDQHDAQTDLTLSAPSLRPTHVRLRWRGRLAPEALLTGDAWERSYGDLQWQSCRPERVLPWYVAITIGRTTSAYGVLCGASAFAFWQCDRDGITLWLDVQNGGEGITLGQRVLRMASITMLRGDTGEGAQQVLTRFCNRLSPSPRRISGPVFGTNDWYYAYGRNTAVGIERDADLIASLTPTTGPRPYTIVDDGWNDKTAFPDMHSLATSIRNRGAKPGIWIRPLQAHANEPSNMLLPTDRFGPRKDRYRDLAYDPTIPEALERATAKAREAVAWSYELVKHDFSTYELLGRWGNEMGASPTLPGWHFNDRSRTNAEVITLFYQALRNAVGEKVCMLGCNTVGHLSAGWFEINRTGDDVSGKLWERTRRMGVNTLAFRLMQNRSFFLVDADCVPITPAVDWNKTSQWLDLVARSGTVLILSPDPEATGMEQKNSIRTALQNAIAATDTKPVTWQQDTTPDRWRFHSSGEKDTTYSWTEAGGTSPFQLVE
jgi:alpha-galactosidase